MTTDETLRQIEDLQRRCEEYDGISLKLNWESLRREPASGGAEIRLAYEDGLLTGFIGVYPFGSEVEVCGMLRPGYRRRGIFTSLWKQAFEVISQAGAESILLNAPAASASGAGFLQTLPLVFNHAEYQMKWDESKAEEYGALGRELSEDKIILRPARPDETPLLASLDSGGFGMNLEDATEMFKDFEEESGTEHIIIEYAGEAAGKLRLWTEDNETWIYGFTVDEKLRGKGIGRSALLQTIARERHHGNGINLEVALDNPNALKLYESSGFVMINKQDYYRYNG
ncbi:GNAT family N-acetyltransferase [Paenibacillus sp. HN-1]|uniref:GNAT family N-acetyltransferase n=1 Tax=Paenibacillus TaxID=44249 RepID=UPI001CA93974|nr:MULTISPECIES: GNAT family N-acetyltransferase [Paenibacillus]MBY9081728.1 GNAT family N-acetyltransferase [Paenibacillus sp. CGMCC 1.18879]MBY9083597.1 GNAT family N-acetyltransferase [Paenibacillus sinensis]